MCTKMKNKNSVLLLYLRWLLVHPRCLLLVKMLVEVIFYEALHNDASANPKRVLLLSTREGEIQHGN